MADERWDVEALLRERFNVPEILAEQNPLARQRAVQRAYRERVKVEAASVSCTCAHGFPPAGDNPAVVSTERPQVVPTRLRRAG